jgi:hypothetical protein
LRTLERRGMDSSTMNRVSEFCISNLSDREMANFSTNISNLGSNTTRRSEANEMYLRGRGDFFCDPFNYYPVITTNVMTMVDYRVSRSTVESYIERNELQEVNIAEYDEDDGFDVDVGDMNFRIEVDPGKRNNLKIYYSYSGENEKSMSWEADDDSINMVKSVFDHLSLHGGNYIKNFVYGTRYFHSDGWKLMVSKIVNKTHIPMYKNIRCIVSSSGYDPLIKEWRV